MSGYFTALRASPAGREHTHRLNPDGSLDPAWLLVQWTTPDQHEDQHEDQADQQLPVEPVTYWLSNLPEDIPIAELVRLGKIRWRIEHDYRELKEALGLDHLEGPTWAGWHRRVTLVTAAHVFATALRADPDPKLPGAA